MESQQVVGKVGQKLPRGQNSAPESARVFSDWKPAADGQEFPVPSWLPGIAPVLILLWLDSLRPSGTATETQIVAIAGFILVVAWFHARRRAKRLMNLADLPMQSTQFGANLSVKAFGLTFGEDEVAVSFVGPWLHVQGVRSCFSLRSDDVRKLKMERGQTSVHWKVGHIAGLLCFREIQEIPRSRGAYHRWKQEVELWRNASAPSAALGPGPPIRVQPAHISALSGVALWSTSAATVLALGSIVIRHLGLGDDAFWGPAMSLALLMSAWLGVNALLSAAKLLLLKRLDQYRQVVEVAVDAGGLPLLRQLD